MKKLKIGIFMDDFYPSVNGVVLVIDNYARRLSKIADVTLVVPYTSKTYVDKFPYKVIRLKSHKMHIIDYSLAETHLSKEVKKELVDEHFDIIHIHSPFAVGKIGLKLGKELDVPVIATMHTQFHLEFKRYSKSNLVSKMLVKMIMSVFNKCYKCYAVNSNVAKIFNDYGAKDYPGVLNNGTELELISSGSKADEEVNKKFGLKKDETLLLFLGRVNILKNILFVADVLAELKKRGVNYKMMYVGTLEDGDVLKNKIHSLGLDDEVFLTGKIMDRDLIAKIYHRAKLFLFPSLYDASSLVQIEASSQKTPTVFINGAATSCSVIDNVNGFLAPNDVQAFADRVEEILKDEKLYNKVAQGCYKDLYKTWDDLTKDLYKTYQNIIKSYNDDKKN